MTATRGAINGLCARCSTSISGKPSAGVGKTWFCQSCYDGYVRKIRSSRMNRDLLGKPFLEKRYSEMRAAIADRDRAIGMRDKIKEQIRSEVESEVIDSIRKMSFWRRLRLCFNPFWARICGT